MDKPSCEFCKFMGLDTDREGNEYPVCRRYAPKKLHGSGTGYDRERWPSITHNIDWCGEFEKKYDPQSGDKLF